MSFDIKEEKEKIKNGAVKYAQELIDEMNKGNYERINFLKQEKVAIPYSVAGMEKIIKTLPI